MSSTKLKKKIVIALAAVVLSAAVGFALVMSVVLSAEAKKAQDLVQSYTESVAHGITAFFAEARALASAATTLNSVQSFDWNAAGFELAGFVRATPYANRISLVDAEGYVYDAYAAGPAAGNRWQGGRRTVNDSDPEAEAVNITGRPYFRALVTENVRGEFRVMTNEVYFPFVIGGKTFATTASIIKGGKAIGVINVAQTVMELSMLYEDISIDFLERFGKDAHMFLLSSAGELISKLEYNKTYGAYMDELFGSDEVTLVSSLGEDVAAAIDATARIDKLVLSFKINGRSHYVAGVGIENTPFAVCLAVSKRQMLLASRYIAIISTFFFLLTAFIGCLAFFVIANGKIPHTKGRGKLRDPSRLDAFRQHGGLDEQFASPELPMD